MASVCAVCKGEGWVCEDHPNTAWDYGQGCCGGAGMPCVCNKSDPAWFHNDEREPERDPDLRHYLTANVTAKKKGKL